MKNNLNQMYSILYIGSSDTLPKLRAACSIQAGVTNSNTLDSKPRFHSNSSFFISFHVVSQKVKGKSRGNLDPPPRVFSHH